CWSKRAGRRRPNAVAVSGGEGPAANGFRVKSLFARQQGCASATETGVPTKGCATCRATRADYCCRAICVAHSKVGSCTRRCGCIVAGAVDVSSPKRANSHRWKHYKSGDLVGECPGHTARPLPEDSGRFNRLALVHVRGSETRFDYDRDTAAG